MFTGLVEAQGHITKIRTLQEIVRFELHAPFKSDLHLGDSVSVNGICLTVSEITDTHWWVEAIPETLVRTTLGSLKEGDPVNLERALLATDRLGGHFVQGHVDGVAPITEIQHTENCFELTLTLPPNLEKYTVEKGSIAIEGVSLTIAKLNQNRLTMAIIPHTAECTTLGRKQVGDLCNIEVDLLAKYIEKLTLVQNNAEVV